jgi:hypothetical protein
MNFDFKKILQHLIVVAIFFMLTFIYFLPMFQGKAMVQHDITQWQGMSKEIVDFREQNKTEPLWTNRMFSGMPAFQISTLYPGNLLASVNTLLSLGMPSPAYLIFIGLLSFYFLLLTLNIDYRLAAGGAISYAFVSFNFVVIQAGHNSEAHAIVLFPLVIAGVMLVFNKKYLLGGAVTALGLGLELYANHLQIAYYIALTIMCLVAARSIAAIMNKDFSHVLKSAAVLIVAVILGVLPNITNLLVTQEYGLASTRGPSELTAKKSSTGLDKDYALSWSNGKRDAITLLIADATGGASTKKLDNKSATYKALEANGVLDQAAGLLDAAPIYWGGLPSTSGPVYAGAMIIFFCVLGMFVLKGPDKYWLAVATVLSITLSWGRHFMPLTDFFFEYFPAYNKFRSVSMIMVIASFCLPLLAMLGLQRFFSNDLTSEQKKKALMQALYLTGGLCIVVLFGSYMIDYSSESDQYYAGNSWLIAALKEDRASILRSETFRSLAFILMAFALVWFTLKDKLKVHVTYMLLAFLFLIDMWGVSKRYLNDSNFTDKTEVETPFQQTAADAQILQDKSLGYRVMNTTVSTFNDASTSYFHNSIGGYHGAKLKRYQELIEGQLAQGNQSVLNMLNTKYFIFQDKQSGQPLAQMNPQACGNAWFVPHIVMVKNADEELAALTGFNPLDTAFVDVRFQDYFKNYKPSVDSTATITLTKYDANFLSYTTKTSSEQFAVLSEIYYDKGWNAYIDDKPASYVRCNYVLRGMLIPAGTHKIDFKFEPATYVTGEKISLAGSIVLLAGCLLIFFFEFKNRKPEQEAVAEKTNKKK